jgi:phosphoenolpyruvate carboxylase
LYAALVHDPRIRRRIFNLLLKEFALTESAILKVTIQSQLLAKEAVLRRSIKLRNPYIDPLNYVQVEMIRRMREGKLPKSEAEAAAAVVELTINGISAGLKNTG